MPRIFSLSFLWGRQDLSENHLFSENKEESRRNAEIEYSKFWLKNIQFATFGAQRDSLIR